MRHGRPKVALILMTEERQRLESLAHRSRSAAALARRARIILACADGTESKVVARRLHVTPGTVCKWRGRFVTRRLDGLDDEPRPGAERNITDAQVVAVVIRTLETTPRGATHWSTGEIAKAVGLSHTAIARIGHTFGRPLVGLARMSSPLSQPLHLPFSLAHRLAHRGDADLHLALKVAGRPENAARRHTELESVAGSIPSPSVCFPSTRVGDLHGLTLSRPLGSLAARKVFR